MLAARLRSAANRGDAQARRLAPAGPQGGRDEGAGQESGEVEGADISGLGDRQIGRFDEGRDQRGVREAADSHAHEQARATADRQSQPGGHDRYPRANRAALSALLPWRSTACRGAAAQSFETALRASSG